VEDDEHLELVINPFYLPNNITISDHYEVADVMIKSNDCKLCQFHLTTDTYLN